ncbi:uncharacterized protein LOC143075739 isoform X2 [Mytilus galloprovincialis]
MELQNKENVCQFEKTVMDIQKITRTPLRTPLHDVRNQDVINRSLKKTVLSHVIAAEPSLKTPTRKSSKIRRSILVYQDKENQPEEEIKKLAFKEVSKVINNAQHLICPPVVNVVPATPICNKTVSYSPDNVRDLQFDDCQITEDLKSADNDQETSSRSKISINTSQPVKTDESEELQPTNIDSDLYAENNHQIIVDSDILIGLEEIYGDVYTDSSDVLSEAVKDLSNTELSPLQNSVTDKNGSVIVGNGSDHTYAGFSCHMCSVDDKHDVNECGTSPMTPVSKTSTETSTEMPSLQETGCSPLVKETRDIGSLVEISTHDMACSPCHTCSVEQETMTEPVTPVKLPEMCDISVQHLIDTVTSACSPIPCDMKSTACSPISNQFTAQYSDDSCSVSTMTNATPVKHDMALQAVPDTRSVLCSPLHPLHTKDCGISATSTQSDVMTNTVIVEQMDQGVDVRPMMNTGSTMTEYLLVNSETSMTPVKLLNKKGHRITADEIRKQHPRILANKLDTYALEAERYKLDIGKVEKERDHFKSRITELKAVIKEKQKIINDDQGKVDLEKKNLKKDYEEKIEKLSKSLQESEQIVRDQNEEIIQLNARSSEEKDQFVSEIESLKIKCSEMEIQLADSTQTKTFEIATLKEELDKKKNDHQMRSAHNLILELQTELVEYKELTDSLKLAEQLQSEIQNVVSDNYRKVRSAADRLMNMKRGVDVQRLEVMQKQCENEKESERFDTEKKEMADNYNSLKSTLETSRSSMMQIETLYESTSADLLSASNQVQILSRELMTTRSALEEANQVKCSLVQQVDDLQENDKAAVQEISNLRHINEATENEYQDFKKWSNDNQRKLASELVMIQEEKERLELLSVNLQRTVDSLNEDIDTLENDLFSTREFSSEQASRLVKLDEDLSLANQELSHTRLENMELRDSLAVFRGNQDYLQQGIDLAESELRRKSSELETRKAELRESTFLLVELENKMASLLQGLRSRAGLDRSHINSSPLTSCMKPRLKPSAKKSARKPQTNNISDSCRKTQDRSFLSMVIKAAEGQSDSEYESCKSSPSDKSSRSISPYIEGVTPFDEMSTICEKLKDRDSIEESPSAQSRDRLGFSKRNSAFAPVRTGTSVIKSKPGPLDSTMKNISVMSQSQLEDTNLRLAEQIECIGETFSEIIRCASIIEKASRLSIDDLQLENKELCEQLDICQTSEQRTKEELSLKKSHLTEAEANISTLTENITSLSDKMGFYVKQEAEISYLKSHLSNAKSQIEQLEAEKQILSGQLKAVLAGVTGEPTGNFAKYHNDITTLKLKIQKLKEKVKQGEEYHETLAIKASKRIKTLDENWKKAEEEVYKFDQLVDTIRETLINSGLIPKHKEPLARIIRMIDGFESVQPKPGPLKPVKTALW